MVADRQGVQETRLVRESCHLSLLAVGKREFPDVGARSESVSAGWIAWGFEENARAIW
jgi:hypothetical protein